MTAYRLYRGALAGRVSRSERHRISAAGAVLRAERYGGFSNRSVLLSNADAKDGLWRRKADIGETPTSAKYQQPDIPENRLLTPELYSRPGRLSFGRGLPAQPHDAVYAFTGRVN
jgi:hypothetical protein